MKRCRIVLVLGTFFLLPGLLWPQDTKEDPAHADLRKLKTQLVEALNKGDVDALLVHLDKDVIVTWMDGRVSKGPKEVREYYERMTKGPDRVVESFQADPTVEELTHLYGNTGVAYGRSLDKFKMTDGSDFTIKTRWSATMVKDGDRWKIAQFHASTGVFDNEVLSTYVRRISTWVGIAAAIAGIVLGVIIGRLLFRRPAGSGSSVPTTAS